MDPLTISGIVLGIFSGIITLSKITINTLKFGFGSSKRRRNFVIYKNKYNCRDPYNAQAWLIVDKWSKSYIYPFETIDECKLVSKKTLYNNVIFDITRNPQSKGGLGFNINICSEVGKKWLRCNFIERDNAMENFILLNSKVQLRYEVDLS